MPLSTYAELLDEVPKWANRNDTAFAAMVPSFVRLAESRMQSDLARPILETEQDVTVVGGAAPLPDNVVAVIGLRINTARRPDVRITSTQRLDEYRRAAYAGPDILGAIVGREVRMLGVADGQTLTVRGKTGIPPLSEASTNRILALWPDLYLRATMAEAMLYLRDDAGADLWGARYAQSLAQVNGQPSFGGQGGGV